MPVFVDTMVSATDRDWGGTCGDAGAFCEAEEGDHAGDQPGLRRGSQFALIDFIKMLAAHEIKLGMDGKGPRRDSVFVGRLWDQIRGGLSAGLGQNLAGRCRDWPASRLLQQPPPAFIA